MKKLVLLVLVASVCAALPATASAKTQRATLRVGNQVVNWQSKMLIGRAETVSITVTVGGRDLDSTAASHCMLDFSGKGVLVRVNVCGDRKPIRVSAANASGKVRRVFLAYEKVDLTDR